MIKAILFLILNAQAQPMDETVDPLQVWKDHLTKIVEGEVRVHSYCNDLLSAEDKSSSFVISENMEGLVYITYKKVVKPPFPKNLSETAKLRKNFRYLTVNELNLMSVSEQEAYTLLEKRMKIYDKFIEYINSLNCFEHAEQGARFSIASELVWKSEKFIDSNLKPKGWKIDIYEAIIDMGSKKETKYIFLGPCRVIEKQNKC